MPPRVARRAYRRPRLVYPKCAGAEHSAAVPGHKNIQHTVDTPKWRPTASRTFKGSGHGGADKSLRPARLFSCHAHRAVQHHRAVTALPAGDGTLRGLRSRKPVPANC